MLSTERFKDSESGTTGASQGMALQARDLRCSYGSHQVLHGLNLEVRTGEIVVILGANGAGKSTLLRCLSGILPYTGSVDLFGSPMGGRGVAAAVRRGIAQVPEGRGTFSALTVEENLRLGAFASKLSADELAVQREYVENLFPRLRERLQQRAGTLSGGEQQMLAIGRALMSKPKMLLLDEPSLGLATKVTREVFRRVQSLHEETGLTTVIVEQNADLSLELADRAYVLQVGHIVASGSADTIRSDRALRRAYLGH